MTVGYKIVYWIIIFRDLTCLITMIVFQTIAANRESYFSRILDYHDKDSTKVALNDFEMLLMSVVPYKAFSRFLQLEHPEMIPYL